MRDQLLPVADAEDGDAAGQNGWFNRGAGLVVNAAGSAGDDDATRMAQLIQRRFAWKNFGRNAEFSNFASDQVAILTARVEYCDLRWGDYFFILSTTILRVLFRSACALGMASMAANTSGSVFVSYFMASSWLKAVL